MTNNPRLSAIGVLAKVITPKGQGQSLRSALEEPREQLKTAQDKGLFTDISYGVCRHYDLLNHWLSEQLDKPIKPSAWPVKMALLAGIYELWFSTRPAHAIVSQYPDICRQLKANWAAGLCNAVLRKASKLNVQEWREQQIPQINYSMPGWLWQQWRRQWGEETAIHIAQASCEQAPLTLRFNALHYDQASALSVLAESGIKAEAGKHSPQAIYLLEPCPVNLIPGFNDGHFSVQDEAAQLASLLMDSPSEGRILDACAAPGGKTGHLTELFPQATLIAVDSEANRLDKIHQNLSRLGVTATVLCADASQPSEWHDGKLFDAILLDAPCSATGILRRQPDVKWHRRPQDIEALVTLQRELLSALWALLTPGGTLVYATCSILQQENHEQIQWFLDQHPEAHEDTPSVYNLAGAVVGAQLLPQQHGPDGFYLARLRKPHPQP